MKITPQRRYGLVACGGKSTRMQHDKAFIHYNDQPQAYAAYDLLSNFCEEVYLCCSSSQSFVFDKHYKTLTDDPAFANTGPAAALLTAASKFRDEAFILLGCDYPFITQKDLSSFVNTIEDKTFAAAFFNDAAGVYEPLLAYYSSRGAAAFLQDFNIENLTLQEFLKKHNALKYSPADKRAIQSIDTPAQALEAREIIRSNTIHRVSIVKIDSGNASRQHDFLAVEEPLEIRMQYYNNSVAIQKTIAITMRTPGKDAQLACGFLFTEGIIRDHSQIKMITPAADGLNTVLIILHEHETPVLSGDRNFYITSSCGVCGKASIESIRAVSQFGNIQDNITIDNSIIYSLSDIVKHEQVIFQSTGGLHASTLFTADGKLIHLSEDIGRHNAMDKLVGYSVMNKQVPLNNHILFLSGRASFELIQKAYMSGIKVIVAVGAPSSLAVEIAKSCNITLIGFLRDNKYNVYTGNHRIN
ncbi:MAG TPA: formate dehydrogenase accessory sulfurtransferase FdhD [Flavitalea sp.]|nr:formate dehydrogenase accessory sulfurtransferase FdhD [Flavitalea sp.]